MNETRLTLRQSTVNDFMVCGLRTKFRMENPHQYKGSVMRTAGTGYHAGLARLYIAFQNGETDITPKLMQTCIDYALEEVHRELDMAKDGFDWRFQVGGKRQAEIVYTMDDLVRLVSDVTSRYIANGYYWDPARYTVLGAEWPFRIPFEKRPENWDRIGTGDLALLDTESNWVILVDHKLTRKKWYANKALPNASVQAAWYVSAAQQKWETEHVTFHYDVMTTAGDFDRIAAHRTPAHIDATLEQAATVADAVEKGGPFIPNTTSFLCHEAYCDWWDICPFGSTLSE